MTINQKSKLIRIVKQNQKNRQLFSFIFIIQLINIFINMRSQTIKQKQFAAIKNITTSNRCSSIQFNNESFETSPLTTLNAIPMHVTTESEKESIQSGPNRLEIFMKSIPKFKEKLFHLRESRSINKNQTLTPMESSNHNFTIKKTVSCSQKLQYLNKSTISNSNCQKQRKKSPKRSEAHCGWKDLEKIQKRNEKNLMVDIEELRKAQKVILEDRVQKSPSKQVNSNEKGMLYNFIKKGKINSFHLFSQDLISQKSDKSELKQKVLLKLSRRHIYHTLKKKSDILHKVRSRSIHQSPRQPVNPQLQPTDSKYHKSLRLHHDQNKKNLRSITFSQTKRQQFCRDVDEPLRVQSKQAQLQSPTRFRNSSPSREKNQTQMKKKIKINTIGSFVSKKSQFYRQSNGFPANQMTELKAMKKRSEESSKKDEYCSERLNIFRQLTPWHDHQTN